MIKLAVVCPCFNEEEVLVQSMDKLSAYLEGLMSGGKISEDSFIMLVDDGSADRTWEITERLHRENRLVRAVSFAHNAGHQYAIFAGMMECRGQCDGVITMDVDLQDELECVEQMVDAYAQGFDVVYGVKVERGADSLMKRFSAETFYRIMQKLGIETVFNHADFRFLSNAVLDALAEYPERNLYLRGLIPQIGFPSTTVNDHLSSRKAGKSKYTLTKMLNLAVNGLTLSTQKPLVLIIACGLTFILISAVLLVILLSLGRGAQPWTWVLTSVWFVSGVILVTTGVTAVYVGKVLDEVKHRPRYTIKKRLG